MHFRPTLAVALIALTAVAAHAQQPPQQQGQGLRGGTRIAGSVKSVTAGDLVLTTANGDVDLAITPQTRVVVRQPADVGDIKAGAYLGTSNQNSADGTKGTATEVHLMDNGPNVNYPMNGSGLTMTNGHVKTVTQTADGEEMDVDYGQATTRHVTVSKATPVTKMVDVGVAALKPGVAVNAVTSPGADGKPMAAFISVGAPPVAKPTP